MWASITRVCVTDDAGHFETGTTPKEVNLAQRMFDSLSSNNPNVDTSKLTYKNSDGSILSFKIYTGVTDIISTRDDQLQDIIFVLYDLLNPSIGTNASENNTGSKNPIVKENMTIVDKVAYNDLVVGQTYTIVRILMDKFTGNAVMINGQNVTASKTFVANSSSGFIDLEFIFAASDLAGKSIVVFEKLFLNDFEVTSHEDINGIGQIIEFRNDTPEIKTSAKEKSTGLKKNIVGKAKTVIVNTISYINLIVGKQYTISGILMDKSTDNPLLVNGNEIKAERTFIPTTPNGTIDLEFIFHGSIS
ncbi:hypothetical protein ALNOE001_01110 [Candidatus Methanobinarius endosymbioticus]|uniref:T-Q ester bond containing domain-containing protein n=1 Tax=Candidatus Methanobinarius endosymbioticus TaxID=2006182 RepID=A0A366MFU6_9EURY|nr:hypothetical protein ALNOE001_01110 [Candidatus Methanobinarius endosymbioticus]